MLFERIRKFRDKVFDKIEPRYWVALIIVVLGLVILLIAMAFRKPPDPMLSDEIAKIQDSGVLKVGVRANIPKFSLFDAATNDYTGLEADIAREIANKIFGDPQKIEFIPVDYTTRGSKLSRNEVDCVIALCETGYSSSFAYSQKYFTDAVGIIAMQDGPEIIADLQGAEVGVIVRPGGILSNGAKNVITTFSNLSDIKMNIVDYTAAPDMFNDLKKGEIEAVALEGALIEIYFDDSMQLLPDAMGTVSYSVVVPAANEPLLRIVNSTLSELEESLDLNRLWVKWQLNDYSDSK